MPKTKKFNVKKIRKLFDRISAIFAGLIDGRNNVPSDTIPFTYEDLVNARAEIQLKEQKALLMKKYKNHYERELEKADAEINRISFAKDRKLNELKNAEQEKNQEENTLNSFGDEQVRNVIYRNIGEAETDIEKKQDKVKELLKQYKNGSLTLIRRVWFLVTFLGYWIFLIVFALAEIPFNIWAFKVRDADSKAILIAFILGIVIPFGTHLLGETIIKDYKNRISSYFVKIGLIGLVLLVAILALMRGTIFVNQQAESGISFGKTENTNKATSNGNNSNINNLDSNLANKNQDFSNLVTEIGFFFLFQSLFLCFAIVASAKYHSEDSKEARNIKLAIWEERRKLKKNLKFESKKLRQAGRDYQKFQNFYESLITTKIQAKQMLDDIDIAELYQIEECRINNEKLKLLTDYKRANLWTRKDVDTIPSNWKNLPKIKDKYISETAGSSLENKQVEGENA
jgi:hypothetical protein